MGTDYRPDYASPPGETLLETLEELGLSTVELARQISMSEGAILAIATGSSPITEEVAGKLEEALHVPRSFWMARERLYRERIQTLEEERRLQKRATGRTAFGLGAVSAALICGSVFYLVHRAQASKLKEAERTSESRVQQAADEGYAAAQQEAPLVSTSAVGYVYLGKCEKGWISRQFGGLPVTCDAPLPDSGQKIVSWHGDVIRSSLPTTQQGRRKFGEPIGRVSAGYTVILRSLHRVSNFASGPQYYWGQVEVAAPQS
jgi:plasmid maintenance system antidote protein VapI